MFSRNVRTTNIWECLQLWEGMDYAIFDSIGGNSSENFSLKSMVTLNLVSFCRSRSTVTSVVNIPLSSNPVHTRPERLIRLCALLIALRRVLSFDRITIWTEVGKRYFPDNPDGADNGQGGHPWSPLSPKEDHLGSELCPGYGSASSILCRPVFITINKLRSSPGKLTRKIYTLALLSLSHTPISNGLFGK